MFLRVDLYFDSVIVGAENADSQKYAKQKWQKYIGTISETVSNSALISSSIQLNKEF